VAEAIVLPSYDGGGVVDLLPSIASVLGFDAPNRLYLRGSDRFVVLLIDGLGWNLLNRHLAEAPYLASLLDRSSRLTAGVPSTTASSLTSLGTGLPPGSHGMVGYTQRIPGTDRLLHSLRWDSEVDPLVWQPHDTLFERLERSGRSVTVISKRAFAESGLTLAALRGGTYIGADNTAERLAAAFAGSVRRPSLTYVYEGDLDGTGHRAGCRSDAWLEQLARADAFALALREALPAVVTLAITGDHGMVDIGTADRVDVDVEPGLMDSVELIGGESRFRHLYCMAGAASAVAARWRGRLGASAVVMERAEAIAAGWFGRVSSVVAPRLGDVMVACIDPIAVESSSRFPMETRLIGMHGSLTADEMYVPLLVDAG
jgi:Type I phosphodiesterase / nucleotide pyrophosphatase